MLTALEKNTTSSNSYVEWEKYNPVSHMQNPPSAAPAAIHSTFRCLLCAGAHYTPAAAQGVSPFRREYRSHLHHKWEDWMWDSSSISAQALQIHCSVGYSTFQKVKKKMLNDLKKTEFLYFKDLSINLKARVTKRSRTDFYSLVHSQMMAIARNGPGCRQEPRTPSWAPTGMQGSKDLGHLSRISPGVGSRIRRTATRTWMGASTECYCYRQNFNLLSHHNSSSRNTL